MNWENVDLKNAYERDQNIIDPLSFDVLLLEIHTNIRDINKETIKAQFEEDLQSRIRSARQVFNNNLSNILKDAKEHRETP